MSQSDFVSRGQALVAAGQFQEAVKVCRLGLLGRPTTVEGRVVLGQALLALRRFDEVLAEMRVALELDHTSVAAQVLRGEALLRKGDTHAAIEALHKARQVAPGDPRILQLLGEAEHGGGRPSVSHPAVGFVGGGEPSGPANYTQPTSLQSPGSERRSSRRRAVVDPNGPTEMTPPPALLAVGDKSGTVEVDPELEGIEVPRDPDFDDIAAPPKGKRGQIGGGRGSVKSSQPSKSQQQPAQRPKGSTVAGKKSAQQPAKNPMIHSGVELDDDDLEEAEETPMPAVPAGGVRKPGPGTAVRNAVAMPSGVIGEFNPNETRSKPASLPPPFAATAPPGAATRTHPVTGPQPPARGNPSVPPPRAPGSPTSPPMPLGMPPAAPLPPAPRGPVAAALPTVAAAQPPPPFVQQQMPYPNLPAAQRPTVAIPAESGLSPAQQQSALAVDQLFGNDQQGWGPGMVDPRSTAAASEPTARPGELDPQILALMSGSAVQSAEMPPAATPLVGLEQIQLQMPPGGAGMRTGVRKARSRTQIVVWLLIGVIVIGGGVFAGLKIRALRLEKQIAAARKRATDLAKADTWIGWTAARDSLTGIVGASSTLENRAALARTRALIAFEFGDGIVEAKQAVDQLGGKGGMDGKVASTFAALVGNDVKAARAAGDAAVAGSDGDAAAQYVAGEAALLAGDTKIATAAMKIAADKEPRPLYGVGHARALAAAYNWDDAITAVDKVRSAAPDHPGAAITRAMILVASGRIAPNSAVSTELKNQLEQIVGESRLPANQQAHGVSPTQAAFGSLALAQVEFARGDIAAAKRAVRGATDINLDDQRFAEATIETLYMLGELPLAHRAGELAMKQYPGSVRARIGYAQALLAEGHVNEAVDVLGKQAETMVHPDALAARGNAYLAVGDTASAQADFDAALKKNPNHEPAIIGRTWLELATGDIESATKRISERMSPKGASLAVTTAYAAALRRAPDSASRDTAKQLLEKVVAGPPGPESNRAQLELARIYRDSGDSILALKAYDKAVKSGGLEARFESALLSIDYSKPQVGREMLDVLLKEAGDRPSAPLVLEGARARLLVGDHQAAAELLAIADKMSSVERFKLDRERARYALRKSDYAGAATAIARALESCGNDAETFLLAADVAAADKSGLTDKVKQLAADRLKGRPELHIVNGKLHIAAEEIKQAETEFDAAKKALITDKASNRRRAQADFGVAVVLFVNDNKAAALTSLDLVIDEDPTIVDAYMFAVESTKDKKRAFGYAKKATQYNPDYAYAWLVVGRLAAELRDKKQLAEAVSRLGVIAPAGDELKELQKLR